MHFGGRPGPWHWPLLERGKQKRIQEIRRDTEENLGQGDREKFKRARQTKDKYELKMSFNTLHGGRC